jgi:hypothetical protein
LRKSGRRDKLLVTWSCCEERELEGWFLSFVTMILTMLTRKRRLMLSAMIMGMMRT